MDHAVTIEEVVSAGGFEERVSAVAHVDTGNGVGDGSGDREVVGDGMLRDRGVVTGKLETGIGGFGEWELELEGEESCFEGI